MATTVDIPSVTNKFKTLAHEWTGYNDFQSQTTIPTMNDPSDNSKNAANTEWVNMFFNNKIPTTPTINVPLLTPMWFDHNLESSAWVKSDSTWDATNDYGWKSGVTYTKVFDHLKNELSFITSTTIETITGTKADGTTYTKEIQCKIAEDGHKIFEYNSDTGKCAIDELFENLGVAWYYIVDTGNNRFKLPRTRYGLQGLKNGGNVGKYDEPGLPNITAQNHLSTDENNSCGVGWGETPTGAFTWRDLTQSAKSIINPGITDTDNIKSYGAYGIGFDASKSNPTYKSNSTVQPPATEMYLFFSTGDENASSGGGGGAGGIVDGKVLYTENKIVEKGSVELNYIVQNDCWLSILPDGTDIEGQGKEYTDYLSVYVNGNEIGKLVDSFGGSGNEDFHTIGFPVKKSSVVKIKGDGVHALFDGKATVKFNEFRLRSASVLYDGMGAPEYEKTVTIDSANYLKKSAVGEKIATEDGYLLVKHGEGLECHLFIDGVEVQASHNSATLAYSFPEQCEMYPISEYSTYKWTCSIFDGAIAGGAYWHLLFIPAKKYTARIYGDLIESNRDATSGNWYRIYSDGWCEQGGYLFNLYGSPSSGDNTTNLNPNCTYIDGHHFHINMMKEYVDSNYTLIAKGHNRYNTESHCFDAVECQSLTKNGFNVFLCTHPEYANMVWRAEGYINSEIVNPEIKRVYFEGEVPDWDDTKKKDIKALIDASIEKTYTIEQTGYLKIKLANLNASVTVNGIQIASSVWKNADWTEYNTTTVAVSKGDVVKYSYTQSTAVEYIIEIDFYPTKSILPVRHFDIDRCNGVIDGTILTKTIDIPVTISPTPIEFYTVKNDCYLYIESGYQTDILDYGIRFYINDSSRPFFAIGESIGSRSERHGVMSAVKAGSKILVNRPDYTSSQSGYLSVIEYKICSANVMFDGIGLPDYTKSYGLSLSAETEYKMYEDTYVFFNVQGNGTTSVKIVSIQIKDEEGVWRPIPCGDTGGWSSCNYSFIVPKNCSWKFSWGSEYGEGYPSIGVLCVPAKKNTARVYGDLIESNYSTDERGSTWWYRIYSDGWCEQGGAYVNPDHNSHQKIVLKKEYSDINYCIYASGDSSNYANNCNQPSTSPSDGRAKTTSSFYAFIDCYANEKLYWKTEGYVNITSLQPEIQKVYLLGETADWNSAIKYEKTSYVAGTEYTFSNDGYFHIYSVYGAFFYIKSGETWIPLCSSSTSGSDGNNTCIPVSKGDKWKYTGNIYEGYEPHFIPYKSTTKPKDCSSYVINTTSKYVYDTWNTTTSYVIGDCVTNSNKYYYCKQANTNIVTTNTSYWIEITEAQLPYAWCREYSDGWCEQGGYVYNNNTADALKTKIKFIKEFSNTSYTFIRNPKGDASAATSNVYSSGYYQKQNGYAICVFHQNSLIGGFDWEAKGFSSL